MYYKTASLILNSEQKSSSSSDIFIAQPDSYKENLAGRLFILIEMESSKPAALKVINFLINNINYNYYQNEKLLLKEKVDSIRTENIFQDSLAKTNRDLVNFLNQEKIKISPYAFNVTAAVIHDEELHFSVVGKNRNFLIYKEKTGTLKKKGGKVFEPEKIEHKITEVGENREQDPKAVNINKLFSNFTSGRIPSGGYFMMGNEALYEYISSKQIVNIITKLSPTGAAEQIKNTLSQVNAYITFLGIIIKNSTSDEVSKEGLKKEMEEKSKRYMNQIDAVEHQTENIMAPSGIINLKKIKKTRDSEPKKKDNFAQKNFRLFKEHISFKRRKGLLKNILSNISKAVSFVFFLAISTVKNMTNKKKVLDLGQKTKRSLAILKDKFSKKETEGGLKNKHKAILISAFVLLIVFSINLTITKQKNEKLAQKEAFGSLVEKIEKKQNKIDANLLYNNEDKAKQLLWENKELLASIAEDKKQGNEKLKKITAKQEEQINRIRHIKKVETGDNIADFSVLNDKANAQNLIIHNNTVYLGDSSQESIYKIDLLEDINTANNELPDNVHYLDYPTATDSGINYLNKDNILIVEKEGRRENIKNIPIGLPGNDNIISMASFNNNLYLLGRKQIYRYSRTNNGFSSPSEWLKTNEDLSKIVDIAIDGYIYILKVDGTIKKLLRGEEEEFENEELYEPIKNANKIITSSEHEYIYIFEPINKRLVVFDKEGKFISQYVFDMENIEDIDVSEKSMKIYVLKNNSVYKSELSHMEASS